MKEAGNVSGVARPETVIRPSSSGWRRSSRTLRLNSGSSSRKSSAVVGQADLARLGHDPAADEAGVGDRVVRGPEGATAHGAGSLRAARPRCRRASPRASRRRTCRGRMVGSRRASMVFPAPGRADEQDVVAAGRRHLEGPLDVLLALDVLEIDRVDRPGRRGPPASRRQGGNRLRRRSEGARPGRGLEGINVEAADQRGLPLVGRGHDEAAEARALGPGGRWAGRRGRA